jgi:hypothetical protein
MPGAGRAARQVESQNLFMSALKSTDMMLQCITMMQKNIDTNRLRHE